MPYYDLGAQEDIYTEPALSVKPEEEQVWAAKFERYMKRTLRQALDSDFSYMAAYIIYRVYGDEPVHNMLDESIQCDMHSSKNGLILCVKFRGMEYRSKKSTNRIFNRRINNG